MKIAFDIDGTLTDFNKFIENNAIKYFERKYGMKVIYPNELEIEDIMDMKNFFIDKYSCSEEEANKMVKQAINKFWIGPIFIKFSLLGKFRKGTKEAFKYLKKKGYDIEIFTSRAKTTENNIVGFISRTFTKLQFLINGIYIQSNKFKFYQNDEQKINSLINSKFNLVFEDKPQVIEVLANNGIKTICIDGNHNKNIENNKNIQRISTYEIENINKKMESLFGVKNLKYYERAANSDIFFNKIKIVAPIILGKFNPIILHEENLNAYGDEGVIYAPNHRKTVDPLVITSIVLKNIHWAALKRFFTGEDSIFNNSKNQVLCKITSASFKKMEYFPIDRKSDNPNANNFDSIKDMSNFLKIHQRIGIFAEGTTRRPKDQEFGIFDDSFIILAKTNNCWIQPITILWFEEKNIKSKAIINFGEPFKINDMNVDEALEYFLEIQKCNLEENKEVLKILKQKIK